MSLLLLLQLLLTVVTFRRQHENLWQLPYWQSMSSNALSVLQHLCHCRSYIYEVTPLPLRHAPDASTQVLQVCHCLFNVQPDHAWPLIVAVCYANWLKLGYCSGLTSPCPVACSPSKHLGVTATAVINLSFDRIIIFTLSGVCYAICGKWKCQD